MTSPSLMAKLANGGHPSPLGEGVKFPPLEGRTNEGSVFGQNPPWGQGGSTGLLLHLEPVPGEGICGEEKEVNSRSFASLDCARDKSLRMTAEESSEAKLGRY